MTLEEDGFDENPEEGTKTNSKEAICPKCGFNLNNKNEASKES